MKKLLVLLTAIFAVAAVRAALPQPDLIAQIHFAGGQSISGSKDFPAFTNEFASVEARNLANQTFDKLSRAPGVWLKNKMAPKAVDGAPLLRPLLDDLLSSEWFFEARDTAGGSPEYVLAIRLGKDRAQLWNQNLTTVLQSWTGIAVTRDKTGNWWLKKHEAPNLFHFSSAGDWVVIDCGQNSLSLSEKISGEMKSQPLGTNWLALDFNWPRLAQLLPGLKGFDFPETKLTLSAADKNLHLNGKLFLPKNFAGTLPSWQMPTNTIHQPFVSFTAARGFGAWLSRQAWAQPYEIAPVPNQLFIWAMPNIPFQTFAATPVPKATDALAQSYARLNSIFNSPQNPNEFFSPFKVEMTNNEIHMVGVPFVAPYMQAVTEKSGQFLLAGAFPNTPRSKPLPPELFQRLAQNNLAFYHWEITAERFPQLLNLTQLGMVLTQHQQLEVDSASLKWLQKITPTLGNTVTEIFETAPGEMTFTRSAPGGLTAFELLALGHWLEAKNFPGYDIKLPSRPKFHPHLKAPATMQIPPPGAH